MQRQAAGLLLVVLAAGCGGGDGPTATSGGDGGPGSVSTEVLELVPGTAGASDGVLDQPTVSPLVAGTWTAGLAPVPITFTVGDGWALDYQGAPGVALSKGGGGVGASGDLPPNLTITTLFDSSAIGEPLPDAGTHGTPLPDEVLEVTPVPDDLVGWFVEHPYVDVGSPEATRVDGHDAWVLDWTVPDLPDAPITNPGGPQAVYLFTLPDDLTYLLLENTSGRIVVVDHDDGWVVLTADPQGDDSFLSEADDVFASVRIGAT